MLFTVTRAMQENLARIYAEKSPLPIKDRIVEFQEFLDVVGFPEITQLDKRFTP